MSEDGLAEWIATSSVHGGWGRVGGVNSHIVCPPWLRTAGYEEDRQWNTFILPLSYHNPGHREDRQWDTFIPPLRYHDCLCIWRHAKNKWLFNQWIRVKMTSWLWKMHISLLVRCSWILSESHINILLSLTDPRNLRPSVQSCSSRFTLNQDILWLIVKLASFF